MRTEAMQTVEQQAVVVSIPTVIAIGAIVMSLNVGLHELIHAVACPLVGGSLETYTALGVECPAATGVAGKIVAGSAPFFNLLLGTILYVYLRGRPSLGDTTWYIVWLFMLANWLTGTGYFLFSGVANVGDMAVVIEGWSPHWLWRGLLLVLGAIGFMGAVALALQVFGTRVGGTNDERYSRASRMAIWSYVGFLIPVVVAALFHPAGLGSLPVVAGLAAVVFGQSPLLWMMQWFQAEMFTKEPGPPLAIRPSVGLMVVAVLVTAVYGVLLGRGINF